VTTQRTAIVISNPAVGAELGHLKGWLADNGFDVRRLVRDDILAEDAADDADLVIVLGSEWTLARPMDAPDDPPQAAAAIAAELALIRRRVEQDRPMLGICFGGQLLSRVLGGEVMRQAAPHIAWETPDTDVEELRAPWVLLHNDAFTVPPGAQLLAEADHAPIAFRHGRAWGVQFHPEVDAEILARMFDDVGTPADVSAPQVEALRSRAEEQRADSLRLFDRFWAEVS
jgi:GMP synthase-like glutamine amidotransferase